MRIAHITDLHYSSIDSQYDFDDLLDALLESLKAENREKKIDLVFLTGDLVDKGGKNINSPDCYEEVNNGVLMKLAQTLELTHDRVVLIPGNHDVSEKRDDDLNYLKGLRSDLNIPAINRLLDENREDWKNLYIDGLKKFKAFERRFYGLNVDKSTEIISSNFETFFIFHFGKAKIGVAAFNSAWSCSTTLDKTTTYKLAFGTSQIIRARNFFKDKTDFNIALLHHPINSGIYSEAEEKEMKIQLSKGNFTMLFSGHTHEAKDNFIKEPDASFYIIVTKASLNNPRTEIEAYKSGFSLIDLSYASDQEINVTRHYRKYIPNRRFDLDVEEATRATTNLRLQPNYIGRHFIDYLKSLNNSFDSGRKFLVETISSLSQNYINSPFSEIIEKALKASFERFLPKDSVFTYIRKDLHLFWEIRYHNEGFYHFHEEQRFQIHSTKSPFLLSHSVFLDTTLDGKDESSIEFTQYLIDGKDYHTQFQASSIALPREGKYGKERKYLKFIQELKGKECYEVESKFKALNSSASKKAWTFSRKNIVEGYTLKISDPENRYLIELFGVGTDIYYSNVDKEGNKTDEINIDHRDQLLAPGMEFWLFVSPYISLP